MNDGYSEIQNESVNDWHYEIQVNPVNDGCLEIQCSFVNDTDSEIHTKFVFFLKELDKINAIIGGRIQLNSEELLKTG